MTRREILPAAGLGLLVLGAGLGLPGRAGAQKKRKEENLSRIQTAIDQLEDLLSYLRQSGKSYGGHKKKAMTTIQAAVDELQLCLRADK